MAPTLNTETGTVVPFPDRGRRHPTRSVARVTITGLSWQTDRELLTRMLELGVARDEVTVTVEAI